MLHRRDALVHRLAGADGPGACASAEEMSDRAKRLLAGVRELADAIRARQAPVVAAFSPEEARRECADVLLDPTR